MAETQEGGAPRGAEGTILVFGMPRSGTSWLGKVFDSHPETLYLHEPDKDVRQAGVPIVFPAEWVRERREAIEAFLQQVLANRSLGVTGKLPQFPKSYRSAGRRLLRSVFFAAKALPLGLERAIRVPDLVGRRHPAPRLVWKSINSVGRLGAILRVLAGARAILIVRHPCGEIASILRGHAAGKITDIHPSEQYRVLEELIGTASGHAYGLTVEDLRAMHPFERLAWRWVLFLEQAMADTEGLASCRWLRYEDLCEQPLERTRELFGFAGLGWHSQTEEFLRESTDGESDHYFAVKKDPRRSVSKWRSELSERDAQRILDVVARSPIGRLYLDEETASRAQPASDDTRRSGKGLSSPRLAPSLSPPV